MSATVTGADPRLARAIAECERITRERARNFWYGLKLMPGERRGAMFAVYAWMRAADDLADEAGMSAEERVRRIADFRAATDEALAGRPVDGSAVWVGLAWVAANHALEPREFHDMLDGQLSDVHPRACATWEDLRAFCYRVASTVGLVSIRVWGFTDPQAPRLAAERGIGFQLTNILRDFREDHGLGRTYLPLEDFRRFDLTPERLRRWETPEQCSEFMRAQCERAEQFYARSAPLDAMVTPSCRPTLWAMTEIYRGLLARIRADPAAVMRERRVRLSPLRKAWIAWRARRMCGRAVP